MAWASLLAVDVVVVAATAALAITAAVAWPDVLVVALTDVAP